jgi:hypothetical protein
MLSVVRSFLETGSFVSPWLGSCLLPYPEALLLVTCIRRRLLSSLIRSNVKRLDVGRAYLGNVIVNSLKPSLKANHVAITSLCNTLSCSWGSVKEWTRWSEGVMEVLRWRESELKIVYFVTPLCVLSRSPKQPVSLRER